MKTRQAINDLSRRNFIKGVGATAVTLSANSTSMADQTTVVCCPGPAPAAKANWTIMAFIAAALKLNHASRDGLLQMKQVGSTENINLIAQFDTGTQGPTRRYYLKKSTSETESAKIGKAREKFSDLAKEGSLSKLEAPFIELKNKLQNTKMEPSEIFQEMQNKRFKIVVGNQDQPLSDFFDAILPGPKEKLCFQETYLGDKRKRKDLLESPTWLIPFLFECLFEMDNEPIFKCDNKLANRSTPTGDPLVLRNFLEWGIECYPSKYKMVVIKGHGDGLSVAWDATPRHTNLAGNELNSLRAVELREAFSIPKQGQPACFQFFDIVGFNACLMGMVEVYHKLRHYVGYGIASEGPTPFASWPFIKILPMLKSEPTMTPVALAEATLNAYIAEEDQVGFEGWCLNIPKAKVNGECTIDLSICDLSQLPDVVDYLGKLTDVLIGILHERQKKPMEARIIVSAREKTQKYLNGDYVDLPHFCKKLIEFGSQSQVVELCNRVIESVGNMTPTPPMHLPPARNRHLNGAPDSNGLSIYFPQEIVPPSYARSLEIKEIAWTDFLHEYVKFKKEGVIAEVAMVDSKVSAVKIKWDAYLNMADTLRIDSKTKVTINNPGNSVTLENLSAGMRVSIIKDGHKELGTVKAVESPTVTILQGVCDEEVSFTVDSDTKITINEIPATLAHLSVGQKVTVEMNGDKALELNVREL